MSYKKSILSDALFVAFAAYVMCTPIFLAKALKYGIRLASKPEEAADDSVLNIKMPKKKPKPTKEQEEAVRMVEATMKILDNVDAYDGTGLGQKEIRHGSN